MKIALISQLFWPETGAPSARGLEMARVWRDEGHQVKVVTAFPNHPTGVIPEEYRGEWFMIEDVEGLDVFRSFIYATPNEGFVKRVVSHLSFMTSSLVQTLPRIGDIDVIVATSPPFFPVISALGYSIGKQVPFIFEVRDLWPGIFEELDVITNPLILGALEQVELFLYRRAGRVVVVTKSFMDDISGRGISAEKIETITNGVDLDFFRPESRTEDIRREFGLGDRFVAAYLGTHGIAHGLASHIEAAEMLGDRDDIVFLFVGQGAEKEQLVELADQKELDNVVFADIQPKERMPSLYSAADACFVPLKDIPAFADFIPSKIFEILACETPIIGSVRGEAREILNESHAAVVTEPEDSRAIADAVVKMADRSGDDRDEMGRRGREFVESNYSRRSLALDYLDLLEELVADNDGR